MMQAPHRLQVKLFLENGEGIEITRFISLFHRWIQHDVTEDLLIDVHDYKHVHHGPGILLVGHDGDYSLDQAQGRRGLAYRLKRGFSGGVSDALRLALRRLATAAAQVELERSPEHDTRFDWAELEIQILDRLRYPNNSEVFESLGPVLSEILGSLLGASDAGIHVERIDNDSREPLALRVLVARSSALRELAGAPEAAAAR